MDKSVEQAFNTAYNKIAKKENWVKPIGPSTGNWGTDVFKFGDYKATLSDGGYFKTVSYVSAGKTVWRVSESSNNSGSAYSLFNINEDEFITNAVPLI